MSSIDLSIIIVNWNVKPYLAACLDSIRANAHGISYEVIVVDSASHDGSVEMLRERFPTVTVIAETENVGYTKGNNIGLKIAKGRYLLLLNPDTEIIANALAQMVRYMDDHADVGISGPLTLNSDGTTQWTKRRFPTLLTGIFDSTFLQPHAPPAVIRYYYALDIPDDATADVDWVQGSALLTRRSIYDQIGGLDEGYIMFSEEMDWCKRIRDAGWRTIYLGGARIVHHGGKSTEQVQAKMHIYFQQSKIRYFRKFKGRLIAGIVHVFLIFNYAEQIAVDWLKALIGHKRELRQARIRMYWQVIRALVAADGAR
ncbi:MAG: glycosyltransferase family 2 protein [Anaerolineae bacterium]|nr:glycosyltransferase family 2 protein [Anaerolineae bacterium]